MLNSDSSLDLTKIIIFDCVFIFRVTPSFTILLYNSCSGCPRRTFYDLRSVRTRSPTVDEFRLRIAEVSRLKRPTRSAVSGTPRTSAQRRGHLFFIACECTWNSLQPHRARLLSSVTHFLQKDRVPRPFTHDKIIGTLFFQSAS